MKKILLFFIIVLLHLNIVYSQEGDWFFNSQSLIINIDVSSEAIINPESSDFNVKYINVNLSHFPYESFNQKVIDFQVTPEADIENNALLFDWQNPKGKVSFGYNTKIKTNNDLVKIKEKISFPIKKLPEELKPFIEPYEVIDSDNGEIIKFASKLVEGEDDLYVVVHKVAEWTKNNIEYNLSTLTAKASLKASWVLENRQGVCDELTSLFIAMLRAVGIPAKFISGIAYTNSPLFPENWGSHGWAEVYFPGSGWVPYDVTYGQFGYIDPTHVKLKESFDSSEPSVQYRWLARNVNLETQELDIDASIGEIIGRAKKLITLDANVLKGNIGFGSYNLIEVNLENLEDHYISSEIYMSSPKEVELEENFIKDILLKPKEKKSVFWITKLTEDLEGNFIYTFPFTISTLRNFTKSLSFISTEDDFVYSFEEINEILLQKREEVEKVYSKDVNIDCNVEKKEFYSYEDNLLRCSIKNIGNVFFEKMNLCLKEECKKFDLGISQEKSFNFTIENYEEGKQDITLNLKNADVSKAEYIEVNVLDAPKISIEEIESPTEVSYEDEFKVSFLLSKVSSSNPKNVEIALSENNFGKTWIVKDLSEDRRFIINLLGKDLKKGLNEFNILIEYEDGNGKLYKTIEVFSINLVNVTFLQSIILTSNQLLRSLEDLTLTSLVFISLASFIVFIFVILIIFRRKQ